MDMRIEYANHLGETLELGPEWLAYSILMSI